MAKPTPLQVVKERFGSKDELAKLLYKKLERPFEDEDDESFERRIRTSSNRQLLRLFEAHEQLDKQFGDKSGLVDAIVKLRYAGGKPDDQHRRKLETYRISRLLDLHSNLERKATA